jgi:hypothetical protein
VPIAARWRSLERLPAPRGRDAMPGVYELADAEKRVVYIGQSATDVPNRLRQHLAKGGCVAERAVYWRWRHSLVPQAEEADLLADHVRRFGRVPACNLALPIPRDARRRWIERSSS